MRKVCLIGVLLLAGCGERTSGDAPATAAKPEKDHATGRPEQVAAGAGWNLQSSGEGTALVLVQASGATVLRLFCPSGANRLIVNVPAFEPIGSEERLSFGGGGDAVALVADPRGDRSRGGVSGEIRTPAALYDLLSGPVSASYGAQTSGPHVPPAQDQARALVQACGEQTPARQGRESTLPRPAAHPCNSQDNQPLPAIRIRAIGTEPFWGARIEGRCVTYSHPDDQKGTRIWARFGGNQDQGSWTGALGGRPFVLRTRPHPGCSDGMSDRRYPLAVSVTVSGEQRQGCAEPL